MRKFLSLLLALCMTLSLCTALAVTPVFAEPGIEEEADIEDIPVGDAAFDEALLKGVGIKEEFSGDRTIDIALSEATDISGVRIYSQEEDTSSPAGSPKKWELYVSFDSGNSYAYVDTDSAFGTSGTGYLGITDYEEQAWSDENAAHNKTYLPTLTTRLGYNISAVTDVRLVIKEVYDGATLDIPKIAVLKSYSDAGIKSNVTLGAVEQTYATFGASDVADGRLLTDEMTDIVPVRAFYYGRGTGESSAWGTASQMMDGDLGSIAYTNGGLTIDLGEWVYASGIRYYPPKNTAVGAGVLPIYLPKAGQYNFDREQLNRNIPSVTGGAMHGDANCNTAETFPSYTDAEDVTTTLYDAPVTIDFETTGAKLIKAARKVRYICINNWKDISMTVNGNAAIGEFRLIRPALEISSDEGDLPSSPTVTVEAYSTFSQNGGDYTKQTTLNAGNVSFISDNILPDLATGEATDAINASQNNVGHAEKDFLYFTQNSDAYFDVIYDFGEGYQAEASGVRIYSRAGQPGQMPRKVSVGVSDDGEHYLWSDTVTLDSLTGQWIQSRQMTLGIGGETLNLEGRYVRVRTTDTQTHAHIAISEIAFLPADGALTTYTYDSYLAAAGDKAALIEALIDAIGVVSTESADAINAARTAYDAAPEAVQALVSNYAVLTAAEAAFASLAVYVNMNDVTQTKNGLRQISLTVASTSPIASVSYKGVEADENDWSAIDNGDGTYTVTLAGQWEKPMITDHVTKGWYFATAETNYGWTVGQEIEPSVFQGRYVAEILHDGIGEHIVTITSENGTESQFNLISTAAWQALPQGAALAVDELAQQSTWKARADMKNHMGNLVSVAFDRNATAADDSDYIAASYSLTAGGGTNGIQVMMYTVLPINMDIDFGEATKFSGVRLYKVAQINGVTSVAMYGSDDAENWEDLGTYSVTPNKDASDAFILTDESGDAAIAQYRYLRIQILGLGGSTSGHTMKLAEVSVLKPIVACTPSTVTMDSSELTDAVFTLNTEDDVTGVTVDGHAAAYTFDNKVLTLPKNLFAQEGEYAVEITLSSELTANAVVEVVDTTKASFLYAGATTASDSLRLYVGTSKTLSSLTYGTLELPYDISDGYAVITRKQWKEAYDWYGEFTSTEGNDISVVATYEDASTKTFTVTLDSTWVAVETPVADFEDDEIVSSTGWKVRDESNNGGYHAATLLWKAPATQQNYHTFFAGAGVADNAVNPHYIDIDLGDEAPTYSGLRYTERSDMTSGSWRTVTIYASDTYGEWGEALYSATLTPAKTSHDLSFGINVQKRYIRIKLTGSVHATGNMLHLLALKDFSEYEEKAASTIALIDAIGTVTAESGAAIDAARAAYDELPTTYQAMVTNYNTLVQAETLYANMTMVINVNQPGELQYGARNLVFTVAATSSVEGISYKGEDIDEEDYTVTDNGDGTYTVEIGGAYPEDYYFAWFRPGGSADDAVFTQDNTVMGQHAGDTIYGFFDGRAAYQIISDGLGDHIVTIRFEDGTSTTRNVRTTSSWVSVGTQSYIDAAGDDEVAPSAVGAWRAKTSTSSNAGIGNVFDGNRTTSNHWESSYYADKYTSEKAGVTGGTQVIGYQPAPISLYLDMAETTEIAGFRFYRRNNNLPSDLDIYTSEDGENWTFYKNVTFTATAAMLEHEFDSKIATRYLWLRVNEIAFKTMGTNLNLAEIVLIKPTAKIVGTKDFTYDSSSLESVTDAVMTFNEDNESAISKVENLTAGEEVSASNYAGDASGLTVKAAYIKTLPVGTSNFKITLNNGDTMTFTITLADLSIISYALSGGTNGARGDDDLVLVVASDKEIKEITFAGGTVSTYTADGSTLTIPRRALRSAADLYALLGADGTGEAALIVSYTDGTSKEFTVGLSTSWYSVGTPVDGIFADDEMASKTTWRVRSGSSNGDHPVFMLYRQSPNSGQNYHTSYTVVGSNVIGDNGSQPHYIELDLGESFDYGGLRYYARKDNIGAAWRSTTVYGSDDLTNWVELTNVIKSAWQVGQSCDLTFGRNVSYRYLRIKIDNSAYGSSHATGNMLHVLQPSIFMAVSDYRYDISEATTDLVATMSEVGTMTSIASITVGDGTTVPSTGYSFDASAKTITLKASYLSTVTAVGKQTYTVTADIGSKTTFAVDFYNSSLPTQDDEVTPSAVYAASSKDGAGTAITTLTDGSTSNAWVSTSQTFVRYEFTEATAVSGVRMYQDYNMTLAGKPMAGKIYGTADGETWFEIGNLCCITSSGTAYTTDFGFNIAVKALAVEVTKTRDDIAPIIDEMHVLGAKKAYATKTGSQVGTTELYVNGSGSGADSRKWSVTASSSNSGQAPSALLDGNTSSIWHTDYTAEGSAITWYPGLPAYVIVNFKDNLPVAGVRYTPRSGFGSAVTKVNIYGSTDGTNFTLITSDSYSAYNSSQAITADVNRKSTMFGANYTLRAIKYEVVGTNSNSHATGAELEFYKPIAGDFTVEDLSVLNPAITNSWTVTASSTAEDSDIRYAFDGNESTSWVAGSTTLPITIEIDLGKATNISAIRFDSDTTKILSGEVYISENGSTYTLFDADAKFTGTRFTNIYDFLCNLSARKVKIVITGAQGTPFNAKAIQLLPANGDYQLITLSKQITDRSTWTAEADSTLSSTQGAEAAIDGRIDTMWHSAQGLPVSYTVHFGKSTKISGFNYYPRRNDVGTQNSGNLHEVDVYVSFDNGATWDYVTTQTYESGKTVNNKTCRVSQTLFDYNYTITDIRLDIKQAAWNYGVIGELAFLSSDSSREPKSAKLAEDTFTFDVDSPENILLDITMNDAQAIKGLTVEGKNVDANYYMIGDGTLMLSQYFFEDYGYDTPGSVNFAVKFLLGNAASFVVNVGGGEQYAVAYEAGEGGTMTARVTTQSGVEKAVASGESVKSSADLAFVALPDNGYEVDTWTLEETTPVYTTADRTGWSVSATTQNGGNPASYMLDGNKSSYWHSKYSSATGNPQPDPALDADHPYIVTLDFGGVLKNASALVVLPRQDGASYIRNYVISGTTDGENWFDITSGTLATGIAEKTIYFGASYDLTALKLDIKSLTGSWAYIAELNMLTERELTGEESYVGTASAEYRIDDLFTDAKVSVTFKPIQDGTASVSQKLKNVTSDFTEKSVAKGSDLVMTFTPAEDYSLPTNVTVMMGTTTLKENQDYTYDSETGVLTVKNVTGNISISASGAEVGYYTVTYKDSYGALGNLPEVQSVKGGRTFSVAKSSLVLTGYKFAGWSYNDTTYKAGDRIAMPEENIVLTAVWEKDDSSSGSGSSTGNTGKSDDQGKKSGGSGGSGGTGMIGGGIGSGSTTQYTVTLADGTTQKLATGSVIPDAAAPEGYDFTGWYLDEALTIPYSNQGLTSDVTLYPSYRKVRSRSELTDIQNHWAKDAIGDMYESYIVNGKSDGVFDPDADITRAEFVQILYMMSGQTSDGSEGFGDVNVGDWFLSAVAWAVNSGITQGTTADTFSPYEKITREQMATMIYRYATLIMGSDWQVKEDKTFTDSSDISTYAAYQVRWAADKSIILGRPDGAFDPQSDATRAEAVTMLSRLLK